MKRPLAAVQVPRLIGEVVAPAAMTPECEPVRVRTTVPASFRTVRVMPWEPLAEAMVPWFLMPTLKLTVWPPDGLLGVQATGEATRSELSTGRTTRAVVLTKELLPSFCSMIAFASSTLAFTE